MQIVESKEEAQALMEQRGYTLVSTASEDKVLRFAKAVDLGISITAEVNITRSDVSFSMVELLDSVYMASFRFDFYDHSFERREKSFYLYCQALLKVKITAAVLFKMDNVEVHTQEEAEEEKPPVKKSKTVEEKKAEFWDEIRTIGKSQGYDRGMCEAFYRYWSELNSTGKTMRKEKEKTFETHLRLLTWARNEKTFTTPSRQRELDRVKQQNDQANKTTNIDPKDLF